MERGRRLVESSTRRHWVQRPLVRWLVLSLALGVLLLIVKRLVVELCASGVRLVAPCWRRGTSSFGSEKGNGR